MKHSLQEKFCNADVAISPHRFTLLMIVIATIAAGCARTEEEAVREKPARPVSVMTLNQSKQLQRQLMTGSVAAWKTEQVGFEVTGRVDFVIEPNEEVQPLILSKTAPDPTAIAKVDEERFRIAVETARADVQVAQRRLEANQVTIEQQLPAAISSAQAQLELAQTENDRTSRLSAQQAVSRSEYDNTKTSLSVATSSLASAKAQLAQANAEQLALQAQVLRANHALDEAERNLRNTSLYSSFRGIVSEVHTVPGSYVSPGDPVVTVQMMDPMLVQFEVSADDSRKYPKGDVLTVFVADKNGQRHPVSGMVYTVDSVADSNSRTYTVTLHVRNQKIEMRADGEETMARTQGIFPLNIGPIVTGDKRSFVEQRCLHRIGDSTVVWKVANRKWNEPTRPVDRILQVEPVKVICGDDVIPFLGQWKFVPVQFENPSEIDVENDLITDQLFFPEDSALSESDFETWTDRRVLLQQRDWMLRPGDVVQVAINGDAVEGFYVPMKSIRNESGRTYLHVVETAGEETIARRVEVTVQNRNAVSDRSIQLKVLPVLEGELHDGVQIVIGGSHYVKEGDRVRVVSGREAN
ncbi:HlyD family secretion protein [Mariniblastus fucicola]|uniref:Putative efflux pump membrane fusion protein n=1 Tax=Mariniblastus fucicola TaxID=980251 RepID=A0A5B9P5Y8_9BACT|nr:HlyD family secretion protein [Mariniblastus fucicola]QEG20402.1 putative efflux pump membrane fusion protein [Mariniblastus fucicola]